MIVYSAAHYPQLPAELEVDDMRTEYHPKTGRSPVTVHFDEYGKDEKTPFDDGPPDSEPWKPFRTRLDFDVADFALEAALNKGQTTRLLDLLNRCAEHEEEVTIRSAKDLQDTWDRAAHKCVDVCAAICSISSLTS